MNETEIRAPFDGIITKKYVEESSLISSIIPIYSLQDRNDNWIDFKVKETEINNFEIGDEIMLQGRNDSLTIDGIVESIRRKADFATQKATSEREDVDIIAFNVKVRTNNEKIYPGMRFKLIRNVELGMINVERKTLILLIFIP
ncbi:MAG: HlyD family efflux transporter periplasmic adaptor subunit, partial [Selenomonadaceae bacterium]|nr:HlyD family efflux transporter periplasmic adaptor subunit [Selenomonadaceae bacterium]